MLYHNLPRICQWAMNLNGSSKKGIGIQSNSKRFFVSCLCNNFIQKLFQRWAYLRYKVSLIPSLFGNEVNIKHTHYAG